LLAESKFPVKTKTIAADFSKGRPVFDVIEQELKDIPVGILGTVLKTASV
jgi:17beta-estradiol 17-dehydrogenase / very-long-chain 3-oxoacyl-CoA reductase